MVLYWWRGCNCNLSWRRHDAGNEITEPPPTLSGCGPCDTLVTAARGQEEAGCCFISMATGHVGVRVT